MLIALAIVPHFIPQVMAHEVTVYPEEIEELVDEPIGRETFHETESEVVSMLLDVRTTTFFNVDRMVEAEDVRSDVDGFEIDVFPRKST